MAQLLVQTNAYALPMHWSSWTNTYAAQTNAYALVQTNAYAPRLDQCLCIGAAQTNAYALVRPRPMPMHCSTNAYIYVA